MGIIGKDFKYKKIKNFLSKDEIDICNLYCEIKHRINLTSFDENNSISFPASFFYGDPLMESIMLKKKPIMEYETGKKLLATYSFWRMYTKYSYLKKHKDRLSCEISATINIGSDGTDWGIYMNGNKIDLKPGDAVIYLGCEVEHHREEFKGDWLAQTFIHYVDAEGNNTSFEKDKRLYWGLEK